jgi:hypothetical protein
VQEPAQKIVPPGYQLAADYIGAYARPKGATPFRVPLVPAFAACTAPDSTHGGPLAFPSCSGPAQASPNLTVGTPDANNQQANSLGSVLFQTVVGDPSTPANDADLNMAISLGDVRDRNTLDDYTGELTEVTTIRITDHGSSPTGNVAATTQDIPIPVTVPCASTPAANTGGTCSLTTTINTLIPGAAQEGKRAIWELGQVQVFDGGPDGVAATNDNSLFAVQGVYTP